MRFNPPPNWPPPPEGWSPPPDWQPDPLWPVPPGWALWVPDAEDVQKGTGFPPRRHARSARERGRLSAQDHPEERRHRTMFRLGLASLSVAILAAGSGIMMWHPWANNSAQPSSSGGQAPKSLAVSTIWPFVKGCEGSRVGMPAGKGGIHDFHAGSDTVSDLVASGGGSWEYGQLAIDLSAAPSKSVAVLDIKAHVDRRDVAPPAWIYTPEFGCGPNSADRHFKFNLDATDPNSQAFTDAGVAPGAAGPSNGPAPTEPLGPAFVLSNNQHARIRVDALACSGNYQWRLEILYTETGHSGVLSYPIGTFISYGLGDNTIDYRASWDSSGDVAVSQQAVVNGGAGSEAGTQRHCSSE